MKKYIAKYYIFILILLLLGYTAKINWSSGQWENVLEHDAKGYYAFLPAIFIYDDLNFGFYQEVEVENAYDPNLVYDYRSYYEGQYINKYYVGESILISPFFLTAHLFSTWLGYPADGYSRLYVIALTLAALFYLMLGLLALRKTLILFNLTEVNIFISLSAIVLGTNLFYYSLGEVGMSHVYSFSMISLFIYQITKYFQTFHVKHILLGAVLLGIIILIRPVNGIVLFSIPFLAQSWDKLRVGFLKYLKRPMIILLSIAIVFLLISVQLIIYKIQTGSYFVYSYGEEGFNFGAPQIIKFLFSYKKGFFLYTPICLFALLGFIFLWRDKFKLISLFLFLFLTIYVLSSWWKWYYGGSFSSRVMVDYLPFFAILLGFLYKGASKLKIRFLYVILILLFIGLNQIQTLQYRYYIIHWSEMDKESYWDTFLDIEPILKRKFDK